MRHHPPTASYCTIRAAPGQATSPSSGSPRRSRPACRGSGVVDGLPELARRVARGVPGSLRDGHSDALRPPRPRGSRTSVNTQIGARTVEQMPAIMDRIIAAGATHWQLQLTVAMGNAVDNDVLLLQPYQLLDLMPLLRGSITRDAPRPADGARQQHQLFPSLRALLAHPGRSTRTGLGAAPARRSSAWSRTGR